MVALLLLRFKVTSLKPLYLDDSIPSGPSRMVVISSDSRGTLREAASAAAAAAASFKEESVDIVVATMFTTTNLVVLLYKTKGTKLW